MINFRRLKSLSGTILVASLTVGMNSSILADDKSSSAPTGSQAERLQGIFTSFSQGHNAAAEHEVWQELADNCAHGQGSVGAQLTTSDSSLPKPRRGFSFLNPPFANLPIVAIRFFCQNKKELWASSWYNNNAFGGEFSLRQEDRGIILFDWKHSASIPKIDFRSPVSYAASEAAVTDNQKSIVSSQTIEDALRHWIDQSTQQSETLKHAENIAADKTQASR